MTDARSELFDESSDAVCPFRRRGWRGCAVNPDRFNHTKIPRFLFDCIVEASGAESLSLSAYSPDQPIAQIYANWASFRSHRFNPHNWSLEYVLHDHSKSWAVLLDPDLVVFGAQMEFAHNVDILLGEHGMSLSSITTADFPDLDPRVAGHKYILGAISGCAP